MSLHVVTIKFTLYDGDVGSLWSYSDLILSLAGYLCLLEVIPLLLCHEDPGVYRSEELSTAVFLFFSLSKSLSSEEMQSFIESLNSVSLLEIASPSNEWLLLSYLMDYSLLTVSLYRAWCHHWQLWKSWFALFQNVSQVALSVNFWSEGHTPHPTHLRSYYSQLRRLESSGFALVYSSPSVRVTRSYRHRQRLKSGDGCCHALVYAANHLTVR